MGLLTDEVKALKWYRQAPEGGEACAQRRLGFAYENGEFRLVTNKEEAMKWFQKAMEGGDEASQWTWKGLRQRPVGPGE